MNTLADVWDVWRATGRAPTEIASQQQRRLQEIARYARANAPFYGALYRNIPQDRIELGALPSVTKSELMDHFDEAVTDPAVARADVEMFMTRNAPGRKLYLGRYLPATTSGTTGRPGLFLHDAGALRAYLALLAARTLPRRAGLAGAAAFARHGGRVALIVATDDYSIEAGLMGRAIGGSRAISQRVRLFPIALPQTELVRALNAFHPAIVFGYSTALAWLSEEQEAGHLRIRPLALFTSAEWLAPADRTHLTGVFHCPLRDLYASTEFPGIAAECQHGALHVNSDRLILEPVDEAFRPVPHGHPSHTVLLTNLANRIQPLIRYDLGDSVTMLAEPCACGSPLPAIRVEGRRDDILRFQTSDGSVVSIMPLALTSIVNALHGLRRYQLIQTGPQRLDARLEVEEAAERGTLTTQVEQRLRAYLDTQGLPEVRVQVAPEPPARDPTSGKYRAVWIEQAYGSSRLADEDAARS